MATVDSMRVGPRRYAGLDLHRQEEVASDRRAVFLDHGYRVVAQLSWHVLPTAVDKGRVLLVIVCNEQSFAVDRLNSGRRQGRDNFDGKEFVVFRRVAFGTCLTIDCLAPRLSLHQAEVLTHLWVRSLMECLLVFNNTWLRWSFDRNAGFGVVVI